MTSTPESTEPVQIENQPTPQTTAESTAEAEFQLTPTAIELLIETSIPSTASEVQPAAIDKVALANAIEKITTAAGGRWHIIIQQIGGPILFTSLPERRINIASVVKVPVALLFFKALEEKGIPAEDLLEHLQSKGYGGRTFDQLLSAMLVKSEEQATEILLEYTATYLNLPAQLAEWELQDLDLLSRRFTAEGVASTFERLYQGDFISPTARTQILKYLSEYTPSDDTRIGSLSAALPENYQIYNKRGSLLTPYVVADCAILENNEGDDYLIIIFAYQGEPRTTYEVLEQAQGELALAFWQILHPVDPP